jgi:small subunit ribosomal protein S1
MEKTIITAEGTTVTVSDWEQIYALWERKTVFKNYFDGIEDVQGYQCLVCFYGQEIKGYLTPDEISNDEITERDLHRFLRMPVWLMITEIKRKEGMILLSRIRATERLAARFWENAMPGQVVKGIVTSPALPKRPLFMEVSGINAMVPADELTWAQWVYPAELQEKIPLYKDIEATIIDMDPDEQKLILSIKRLQPDPWETEIPRKYEKNKIFTGEVTGTNGKGTFVRFTDGATCYCVGPNRPKTPGKPITVKITKVNPSKRRIFGRTVTT